MHRSCRERVSTSSGVITALGMRNGGPRSRNSSPYPGSSRPGDAAYTIGSPGAPLRLARLALVLGHRPLDAQWHLCLVALTATPRSQVPVAAHALTVVTLPTSGARRASCVASARSTCAGYGPSARASAWPSMPTVCTSEACFLHHEQGGQGIHARKAQG